MRGHVLLSGQEQLRSGLQCSRILWVLLKIGKVPLGCVLWFSSLLRLTAERKPRTVAQVWTLAVCSCGLCTLHTLCPVHQMRWLNPSVVRCEGSALDFCSELRLLSTSAQEGPRRVF
jgi:hypothetical protein